MAFNKLQVKDLAYGILIEDSSSTLKVAGDLHYSLPVDITGGNFYCTVDREIVLVTDVTVDIDDHYVLDVVREQEGTEYEVHTMGQKVYLNVIAKNINNIQDYLLNLDTTSPLNLNTMYNDIQSNNAKITNQNHTGDITGSTEVHIVPGAISAKDTATPAAGDYVLLLDESDNLLKKGLVDSFLGGGGGSGDVTGPSSSVDNSLAVFDGTSGKLLESSNLIIDGTGNNLSIPGKLNVINQARQSVQHTLDNSGSVDWDIDLYPCSKIIPTDNITLTISNTYVNSNATLYFKQDDTEAYNITFPGTVTWAGNFNPDLTVLGSQHLFNFYCYDGTGLLGSYISDVPATNGLINVADTTSDHYYFGESAILNKHEWSIDKNVIQLGESSSISSEKNIPDSNFEINHGSYLDELGNYKYSTVDNAFKMTLDSSSNEIGFYSCDSTSHVKNDSVNYLKRLSISNTGTYVYDDTGGSSKVLDETSATTVENKRNIPRVLSLTSGATVNWNSTGADIFTLAPTHNCEIMADTNGAGAMNGEIREFQFTSNGTNTITFDTTSTDYAFKFNSDVTEYVISPDNNEIDIVLAQYLSANNKWNIISVVKGL